MGLGRFSATSCSNWLTAQSTPCLLLTILESYLGQSFKELLKTIADVTSKIVEWIINLAPFGSLGLVFKTISDKGVGSLTNYGILLVLLVTTMLFVALVVTL